MDSSATKTCAANSDRLGAATANDETERLSIFADLLGDWKGHGYNLIALPTNDEKTAFRVAAQLYDETLTFELVGCVPNRGNNGPDQFTKAIQYHEIVTTDNNGIITPIHEENGMLLLLEPDSSATPGNLTVARLGSVPHGDSVLALGKHAIISQGEPEFPVQDSRPIEFGGKRTQHNSSYLDPYAQANLPLGLTKEETRDPNLLLKKFIDEQDAAGRHITQTATVELSTDNAGHISNIPFLAGVKTSGQAIDVPKMDFTIWLEQVESEDGQTFAQLQYSQNTILDFGKIKWPHIDVASLVKQ